MNIDEDGIWHCDNCHVSGDYDKVKTWRCCKIKSSCDIMVDQIGGLGYGYNSLEAMAMGIATCTELTHEFESYIPDHPFININEKDIREKLIKLIDNRELIIKKGIEARRWIEKYHNGTKVVNLMIEKYKHLGWKIET